MVRATFSGFNTALSALQANQKRLDITGQNLSNMNTAGYTRQQLEASSLNYTNPVSHYSNGNETAVGFGVSMDRVSQIRDPYLDIQYRSQSADCSYTNRLQTALNSLSKVLDETTISGIRKAFDDVQSTLTSMQDPAKVSDPIYESVYVIFLTRHPDRSHRPNRMNFKGSQGKAAVNRAMCRRSMTSSVRSAT